MNSILNEANKVKSGMKRAGNDIKKVKSLIPTKNEEEESKAESKQHVPENISNANKGVSIFGFVKDLFMFSIS